MKFDKSERTAAMLDLVADGHRLISLARKIVKDAGALLSPETHDSEPSK